jgi:hypothetical protein
MAVDRVSYHAGGKRFTGALVYNESVTTKRPLLLMAPNWLGATEEAINRTQVMAGSRFIGFVADMYGDDRVCAGPPEAAQLADALRADPNERRLRIGAALSALVDESEKRGIGAVSRTAAVGFCFGGGNVLELARGGADVQAVISLHGDLTSLAPAKPATSRRRCSWFRVPPIRSRPRRNAMRSKVRCRRRTRAGRCSPSVISCIRSANRKQMCPALPNTTRSRRAKPIVSFLSSSPMHSKATWSENNLRRPKKGRMS